MKRINLIFALCACVLLTACRTTSPTAPKNVESLDIDNPMRSEQHLFEILYHAFLWHYDRSYLLTDQRQGDLEIYFRPVTRELDPGDQSHFAELWIPDIHMVIDLKRSNYRIEELGLAVKDDHFKIRRVVRENAPPAPLSSYQHYAIPHARVREWITANLRTAGPLAPTLAKRLRETLLNFDSGREPDLTVTHVFHLAPISPASDDLWVFHENSKQLLLFSSDMDLSNEANWESTPITLKVYSLAPEVILATDGGGASSTTLSKDFVGRALFNCVVLGERIAVSPETAKKLLEEKKQRAK
jgi:hypothetical protein